MAKSHQSEDHVENTFVLIIPWMIMGGSIRCALDVLRVFKEAGYRTITIVTSEHTTGTPWQELFDELSDEIHDLHLVQRTRRGHGSLRTLIQQIQPSVILINDSQEGFRSLPMLRAEAPAATIACLYHMILENWDFAAYLRRWPDAWDLCLTVSSKLREELIEAGVDAFKVKACHWFGHVKMPDWTKSRRKFLRNQLRHDLQIPEKAKVIVFPFRLDTQKRPWMISRIALHLGYGDYWFVIAGSGQLEGDIKKQVAELPFRDRFRFLGRVDLDKMDHVYAAADICVTPSQHEGIPLVYYECMELEIPIICSEVGAVTELVDNTCAVVVPLGDGNLAEGALYAHHIRQLCENKTKRERLTAAGLLRVNEKFSYKQFSKRVRKMLSDPQQMSSRIVLSTERPKEKLFLIGNPFTGEHALREAFRILGLSSYAWDPIIQDYYHHGNLAPIWDVCEQFDVFAEAPFNSGDFYKHLYARFPEARFVMTTRNRMRWEEKHKAHFNPETGSTPERYRLHFYDTEEWRKWYERRQNEITAFFTEHGALNRLVSVDVFNHRKPWEWAAKTADIENLPPDLPEFPSLDPPLEQDDSPVAPPAVGRVRNRAS